MPEQRDIVVDVKTPLDAYLAAVEAQDRRGAQRAAAPSCANRRRTGARAVLEAVLVAVRTQSGFRRLVPAGRSVSSRGAAGKSGPDRRFDAPERHAGDADQFGCAIESRLLRMEANGSCRRMPRRFGASARSCTSAWRYSASISANWANPSAAASSPSIAAVGSLEQQVLPAARRFPELGLRVNREIEPIEPVANLAAHAARRRQPRAAPPMNQADDDILMRLIERAPYRGLGALLELAVRKLRVRARRCSASTHCSRSGAH